MTFFLVVSFATLKHFLYPSTMIFICLSRRIALSYLIRTQCFPGFIYFTLYAIVYFSLFSINSHRSSPTRYIQKWFFFIRSTAKLHDYIVSRFPDVNFYFYHYTQIIETRVVFLFVNAILAILGFISFALSHVPSCLITLPQLLAWLKKNNHRRRRF